MVAGQRIAGLKAYMIIYAACTCLLAAIVVAQPPDVSQFIPSIRVVTNKAGAGCPHEDREYIRALLTDQFNNAVGVQPGSAYVLGFQTAIVSLGIWSPGPKLHHSMNSYPSLRLL
jgi:hypothetical protein